MLTTSTPHARLPFKELYDILNCSAIIVYPSEILEPVSLGNLFPYGIKEDYFRTHAQPTAVSMHIKKRDSNLSSIKSTSRDHSNCLRVGVQEKYRNPPPCHAEMAMYIRQEFCPRACSRCVSSINPGPSSMLFLSWSVLVCRKEESQ